MIEALQYQHACVEAETRGECRVRQDRLRADVVEVLTVRFGPLPAALRTQLRRVGSLGLLAALHRRAVVVEGLALFSHELALAQLGQPE